MVRLGAGGIIIENDRVLLIKRINSKTFNNLWANPGGHIEPGESAENACRRELSEELGIEVEVIKQLGDYLEHKDDQLHGKSTGFLCKVLSGKPKICEPEKIAELKFWPLSDLPTDIAPYTMQYLKDLMD